MKCRKCGSSDFRIRQGTGIEFLVLLFISLRKYTCQRCGRSVRAPDRRQRKREEKPTGEAEAFSLTSR
jgi:hypothetical protein